MRNILRLYYKIVLLFFTYQTSVLAMYTGSGWNSGSYKSYSSKDNSGSSQQLTLSVSRQEAVTQKLQSLTYPKNLFNAFDAPSQQLVSSVAQKLQTASSSHEYALNLGMFNALAIIAAAQQKPTYTAQLLNAAYQSPNIQQQQAELIKNDVSKMFPENTVQKACTQAQVLSNTLIHVAADFAVQGPERSTTTNTLQFSGLKQIKEFVGKFGDLSTEAKKTVGSLLLGGNVAEALKLISVGDKGVYNAVKQCSSYDKILNPEMSPFIKETSKIIEVAFVDAVHDTVKIASFVPNIVGASCLAARMGKDLYQGEITLGEIAFNAALAFGVLKGIQLTGKGIKVLYQHGKGAVQDIIANKTHVWLQQNNKPSTNVISLIDLEVQTQKELLEAKRVWETLPRSYFKDEGTGVAWRASEKVVELEMKLDKLRETIIHQKSIMHK